MSGNTVARFAAPPGAALALLLWVQGAAWAATVEQGIVLPGIPQSGDPSFTFEDPMSQGGGDFSSTISSWYDNYVLILPDDTGYDVYAYNSGDFEYEQTAGENYEGKNGALSLNAQLDQDGNVIGGEYLLTGEISEIGITSTEVLTTGDIVGFSAGDTAIGFATDNISCASEIDNCLIAESVYIFTDGSPVPELSDLDGTAGYVATTASLTTVPLPGSTVLFMSALGLLLRRAQPGNR